MPGTVLMILMVLSNDYLSLKINRQYKAIICTEKPRFLEKLHREDLSLE